MFDVAATVRGARASIPRKTSRPSPASTAMLGPKAQVAADRAPGGKMAPKAQVAAYKDGGVIGGARKDYKKR